MTKTAVKFWSDLCWFHMYRPLSFKSSSQWYRISTVTCGTHKRHTCGIYNMLHVVHRYNMLHVVYIICAVHACCWQIRWRAARTICLSANLLIARSWIIKWSKLHMWCILFKPRHGAFGREILQVSNQIHGFGQPHSATKCLRQHTLRYTVS